MKNAPVRGRPLALRPRFSRRPPVNGRARVPATQEPPQPRAEPSRAHALPPPERVAPAVTAAAHTPAAHRADIQGLRAVAVLLVVLGHAGVGFVSGGFVGVDVFFVLSGFLITGLLLAEARSARLGVARRLLPPARAAASCRPLR